jgi:hypothetical protein
MHIIAGFTRTSITMPRVSLRLVGLYIGLALLSLILPGCGGSQNEVSGQVTYNGKALDKPGGFITFVGSDGVPVTTAIDSSGNYRAIGVRSGDNKVAVFYQRPPAKAGKRTPGDPGKGAYAPKQQQDSPILTPDSYSTPETSGLSVVVESNTVYNPKLTGPEIQ